MFKKLALVATVFTMLMSCNSETKGKNGVVYKSAVQYNQYIMENQKDVINVMIEFGKVIDQSLDSADQVLDRGIEKADDAMTNVSGMPPFRGDTAFRNAAINSFEFYKSVLSNEYRQIVNVRRKGENKTTEDFNFLQKLPDEIGKREEKLDREFHNAQKAFADRNHLTLVRNDMQDKIDEKNKND
jgi:hypothetical protein